MFLWKVERKWIQSNPSDRQVRGIFIFITAYKLLFFRNDINVNARLTSNPIYGRIRLICEWLFIKPFIIIVI